MKNCPECGKELSENAIICVGCGVSLDATAKPNTDTEYSSKSKIVAFLLQFLLNGYGIGRFYTGHIKMAVIQLALTLSSTVLIALFGSHLLTDFFSTYMELINLALTDSPDPELLRQTLTEFFKIFVPFMVLSFPSIVSSIWCFGDSIYLIAAKSKDSEGKLLK